MTHVWNHKSNPGLSYFKTHALDSALISIPRVKEIVQYTNENKEVQRN